LARPKSFPERDLASAESARQAFLRRHPDLATLADLAPNTALLAQYLEFRAQMDSWYALYGETVAKMPAPPTLSAELTAALRLSGADVPRLLLRLDSDARTLYAAMQTWRLIPLQRFEYPPRMRRDRRLLLAVFALVFANAQDDTLRPLDLAQLAVIAGLEKPGPDNIRYRKLLDNWRKKFDTIRILWAKSSPGRRGFSGSPPRP
jgi:hypothetical protein